MKSFKLLALLAVLVGSGAHAQTITYDPANCDKVEIEKGYLMQERALGTCGGSIKPSKSNGNVYFTLSGLRNCSNLFLGVNAQFESKGITRYYKLDEGQRSYSSWTVPDDLVTNPNDKDLAKVRLVLLSNSGKTCTKIEIQTGKVH